MTSRDDFKTDVGDFSPISNLTAPSSSRSRAAARDVRGGGGEDASPSNTASYNCNSADQFYFQPLRWGVDSLYLSYAGELARDVETQLQGLKQNAQSPDAHTAALAQYRIGNRIFEVKDKGKSLFPYIIEDGCFQIQLSRAKAKQLPMAYVKIASKYLSAVLPANAADELGRLIQELGTGSAFPSVSRIDLFVDFCSSVEMESWNRDAWVTRASAISYYTIDRAFTGWAIGQGSGLSARLYDKTLEIESSGKDYLRELWTAAGWNGKAKVWRLEFQFKRDVLVQLKLVDDSPKTDDSPTASKASKDFVASLGSLGSVLQHMDGLWSYATTEWLRLTLPNESDETRSRWAIHPLWAALASVDWEGNGGPLLRQFDGLRVPSDETIYGRSLSALISYMAVKGIDDLSEAHLRIVEDEYRHHGNKAHALGLPFDRYVLEKVQAKRRLYNTAMNREPRSVAERQRVEQEEAAEAYRRASDGH